MPSTSGRPRVARGAGFDAVRLQILIVDAPAGGRDARIHVAREPRARSRADRRAGRRRAAATIAARSARGTPCMSSPNRNSQPLYCAAGAPRRQRQPAGEVRLAFVRDAGEMRPLVRDDERTLDRQQIAGDQRLEKERIGHAVDAGAAEIGIEQRALRPRRDRGPLRRKVPLRLRERSSQRPDRSRRSLVGAHARRRTVR